MPYSVSLKQFEGPLDLLLHLVDKAQVDIRDIFVSEITSQYLEFVNAAEDIDMETASEFLTMAATLLYIKSRSLLPKPPAELEDDEEDPELMLVRRLREYKAYKEASKALDEIRESCVGMFSKPPEEFVLPEPEAVYLDGTTADLYAAFCEILQRADDVTRAPQKPAPLTHEVVSDEYTVRGCINDIRVMLFGKENIEFRELFDVCTPKIRIIVTFMALLEMLMRGEIIVKQPVPYGKILILQSSASVNNDSVGAIYMDEEMDEI